jgi:hypothetical protein
VNEEALAHWGAVAPKKKTVQSYISSALTQKRYLNYQYFQSLVFDFSTVNLQINKYE